MTNQLLLKLAAGLSVLLAQPALAVCSLTTIGSEYQVGSYADLKLVGVADCPTSGNYRLTADIDAIVSATEASNGTGGFWGFTPIGFGQSPYAFSGKFHGGLHVIRNLTVNHFNAGLFLELSGTVDSLGVEGVSINTTNYAGCIASYSSGIVDRSYCTGSVTSTGNYVGGLVGLQYGQSTISNSYANVAVTGQDTVGGLVGISSGTLQNSYSQGAVSGRNAVGGLAGQQSATVVENCFSKSPVTATGTNSGAGLGRLLNATVQNSYWDSTSFALPGIGAISGGSSVFLGLSTIQMQATSSFSNWDFTSVWFMGSSNPQLRTFAKHQRTLAPLTSSIVGLVVPLEILAESGANIQYTLSPAGLGTLDASQNLTLLQSGTLHITAVIPNNDKPGFLTDSVTLTLEIAPAMAGSGTDVDPFLVTGYPQLKAIGSGIYGLDKTYRLTQNIDASASATDHCDIHGVCLGFAPIGIYGAAFTGSFHGQGYAISHLTISRPATDEVGLFGITANSVKIDSVNLKSVDITGNTEVGGLVGNNRGNISVSSVTGKVFSASITSGEADLGGLAGLNYGVIDSCFFSGVVKSLGLTVGGLVGINVKTIARSYATGAVWGGEASGGLVGVSGNTASILNSYSAARVNAGANKIAGGLVGQSSGNIHMSNSASTSYASGQVVAADSSGGIIGDGGVQVSTDLYWDRQASALNTCGTPSCSPLTTNQMRQSASFVNWDFINTWQILEGKTYPALRSVLNAPFAFADTLPSQSTFALIQLAQNDYSVHTEQQALVVRVDSLSGATTDSLSQLTFDPSAQIGDTATVRYQVGVILAAKDTLWGNFATSKVVLSEFQFTALAPLTYGDVAVTLHASISPSFALRFESSDSSIVSVSGSTLNILAPGAVTISAFAGPKLSLTQSLSIATKELTLAGAVADSKVYDGTTIATYHGATLSGVVASDDVAFTPGIATFDSATVGSSRLVTIGSASLTGTTASRYHLTQLGNISADITNAPLTITAQDLDVAFGDLISYRFNYSGFVHGENAHIISGLKASRIVGDNGSYVIIASGAVAPNYDITYLNGTLVFHEPTSATLAAPINAMQNIHRVPGGMLIQGVRGTVSAFNLQGRRIGTWNVQEDGIYPLDDSEGILLHIVVNPGN